MLSPIHLEDVIANSCSFRASRTSDSNLTGATRSAVTAGCISPHESRTQSPVRRASCIVGRELVLGFVPRASHEKSAAVRFGPAPFLHVARHVACRTSPGRRAADSCGTLSAEIADRQDVTETRQARRTVPMMCSGQALAGERRIRRRLMPSSHPDREIGLAVRVGPGFPRRGPRPSCGVTKSFDRPPPTIPIGRRR